MRLAEEVLTHEVDGEEQRFSALARQYPELPLAKLLGEHLARETLYRASLSREHVPEFGEPGHETVCRNGWHLRRAAWGLTGRE